MEVARHFFCTSSKGFHIPPISARKLHTDFIHMPLYGIEWGPCDVTVNLSRVVHPHRAGSSQADGVVRYIGSFHISAARIANLERCAAKTVASFLSSLDFWQLQIHNAGFVPKKGDKPTPPLQTLSSPTSWQSAPPINALVMAGGSKPALRFRDAGDYALIDLPELSTAVQASFTGDSVHVRSTDGAKNAVFEVLQLYSTIDAERSRLETLDHGVRLHLRKLVPSEAWPQIAAPDAIQAPKESPANALQERKAVEKLLKAAQAGDVEAFDSSALHFGSSDLSSVKDGNERNALHFTAASGQPEFCRYLLTEKGFPVDAQDSTGKV